MHKLCEKRIATAATTKTRAAAEATTITVTATTTTLATAIDLNTTLESRDDSEPAFGKWREERERRPN